jgi:hypothetical protein
VKYSYIFQNKTGAREVHIQSEYAFMDFSIGGLKSLIRGHHPVFEAVSLVGGPFLFNFFIALLIYFSSLFINDCWRRIKKQRGFETDYSISSSAVGSLQLANFFGGQRNP